ncbi:MAG TPA: OmpA family protein [Anaeromyxobacteraceae bacterium]|nr:OmpA family protein [Anaeromyxobacteraceae bacterium]
MTRRAAALLVALLAGCATGCATGGKLRAGTEAVAAGVEKAKRDGAERCAPRELALAEAHAEFARTELRQADPGRAREHLTLAEGSLRRAVQLTSTCAAKRVDVPLPPPPVPAKLVIEKIGRDTDADGTPDDIDRCPLDAEDGDGFQDEDGCPDPDDDADGVVDRVDACPREPGPVEAKGCPAQDQDADGVLDAEDRCPLNAGPRENAGCPEPDRDRDGFADRVDPCPDEPGVAPDGCPKKYRLVVVKQDRIEIRQQVHFATGKYAVRGDSFPLLNQVVQVLNDQPRMRVRIEGHTDDVGAEAVNLRLSQRRADAVRRYLVKMGVAPDRLEAVGHGPTQPIAPNGTAKGRAKNRRTEFRIVE